MPSSSNPTQLLEPIGNRARLLAPEVFPTGIDVLHLQTGRLDNEGVEALNQKFWSKFEKADFSKHEPLVFLYNERRGYGSDGL